MAAIAAAKDFLLSLVFMIELVLMLRFKVKQKQKQKQNKNKNKKICTFRIVKNKHGIRHVRYVSLAL